MEDVEDNVKTMKAVTWLVLMPVAGGHLIASTRCVTILVFAEWEELEQL